MSEREYLGRKSYNCYAVPVEPERTCPSLHGSSPRLPHARDLVGPFRLASRVSAFLRRDTLEPVII